MIRISFHAVLRWRLLAACGETRLDEAPEDLGAFQARVTHVYTEKALQWPMSRDADHSEWTAPIENALNTRAAPLQKARRSTTWRLTLEGFMLAPAGRAGAVLPQKRGGGERLCLRRGKQEKFLAKKHQMEIFESTTGESALLGLRPCPHQAGADPGSGGQYRRQGRGMDGRTARSEQGWFAPRAAAESAGSGTDAAVAKAGTGWLSPAKTAAVKQERVDFCRANQIIRRRRGNRVGNADPSFQKGA